jgi:hypothetical protein
VQPLRDLKFVTVTNVADTLDKVSGLRVESLGLPEFAERLRGARVADLDTPRWTASVFRVLQATGTARLAVSAAGRLKLWTPLVIVARRVDDGDVDHAGCGAMREPPHRELYDKCLA